LISLFALAPSLSFAEVEDKDSLEQFGLSEEALRVKQSETLRSDELVPTQKLSQIQVPFSKTPHFSKDVTKLASLQQSYDEKLPRIKGFVRTARKRFRKVRWRKTWKNEKR